MSSNNIVSKLKEVTIEKIVISKYAILKVTAGPCERGRKGKTIFERKVLYALYIL